MEIRNLSLSITCAISAYSVTFSTPGAPSPLSAHHANADEDVRSFTPSAFTAIVINNNDFAQCPPDVTNSCRSHIPIRPLTAEEVQLIYGANFATGVTVTATRPPDTTYVPPGPGTSISPSQGGGGGGGGGGDGGGSSAPEVPMFDSAQQVHALGCATAYAGSTKPNPAYKISFTNVYGWVSKDANGLPIVNITTPTAADPTQTPPAGGTSWLIIMGSTTIGSPYQTNLYRYAYMDEALTVRSIVHEWYHQTHDYPGETTMERSANETAAINAGMAAWSAYKADNGAKCR